METPHSPSPAADLEINQLHESLLLAEKAVRYHDEELRARVAEVQALDNPWTAAWTTLMGAREQRIERGLLRVQAAQAALARATASYEEARARLQEAKGARASAERQDRQRRTILEQKASAIRGSEHPFAANLASLEEEEASLSTRITLLDEVIAASASLNAAASGLSMQAKAGSYHDSYKTHYRRSPRIEEVRAHRAIEAAMSTYRQKAARLEAAAAKIGIDWQSGMNGATGVWSGDVRSGFQMGNIAEQFAGQRDELKLLLELVGEERKGLVQKRSSVIAQRDALLDG